MRVIESTICHWVSRGAESEKKPLADYTTARWLRAAPASLAFRCCGRRADAVQGTTQEVPGGVGQRGVGGGCHSAGRAQGRLGKEQASSTLPRSLPVPHLWTSRAVELGLGALGSLLHSQPRLSSFLFCICHSPLSPLPPLTSVSSFSLSQDGFPPSSPPRGVPRAL